MLANSEITSQVVACCIPEDVVHEVLEMDMPKGENLDVDICGMR